MFQVIDLDSGQPHTMGGCVAVYATGGDAAEEARRLTMCNPGKKFQPRPIATPSTVDWRAREQARFDSGAYAYPVWHNESWWQAALEREEIRDHFCHISHNDKAKLAYTQSAEKGERDVQTTIRPGAYLKQHCAAWLNDSQIQQWVFQHDTRLGVSGLKLATTPEEIDHAYRNGPRSCMCNEDDYPHILDRDVFPLHPAHVYAAGDLAVAYCEGSNGRVTGRCVVWPEKKLYGRVYGDRIRDLLASAGYTASESYDMTGARLLKVRSTFDSGSYVMPYIDGARYVGLSQDGSHFIIKGGRGDYYCANTSGTTDGDDENAYRREHDERYEDERETWYCESCDSHFYCDEDESIWIHDRQEAWCATCADNHAACCEVTGRYYAEEYVVLDDGTVWSLAHYQDYGFECEDCNSNFHIDDGVCGDDEVTRCQSCHDTYQAELDATREAEEQEEAEERERLGLVRLAPTTPTIPHAAQITMPIDAPQGLYQVAMFAQFSNVFIAFATLDDGRDTMSEREARELAQKLANNYYVFRVQPYQFNAAQRAA